MFYRNLALLAVSSSLLLSTVSHALPQVAENAAQNFAGILTLYPDSEDPNLAYFVPNSAGLVRDNDGTPSFGLTYWGLDPSGPDAGAFMSYSMRLEMDVAQAKAIRAYLATGKRIAVIPFKDTVVNLTSTAHAEGPLQTLFKEFNFSSKAGPAEAEVGVNAILTGIGARVFRAAIESPQLMKIDYCYKFDGLGPKMDAHVTVHWQKVYEDLKAHAEAGGFWFRGSVDTEIEKLRQNGTVNIQIKGGTATMEEYVKKIAEDAVNKLFVSSLENKPVSESPMDGWSFSRLQIAATYREEVKDEDYDYSNQDLVQRDGCLDMKIGDLQKYKNQVLHNADSF